MLSSIVRPIIKPQQFLLTNIIISKRLNSNTITNHREWLCFNKPKDPANLFTISSYNLLSRHYMWNSVYDYLPAKSIDWDNRFELINRNLMDLTCLSDIMCFQEMEYLVYDQFWKDYLLERNYTSHFQMKRKPNYWEKNPIMMDGVSIFVNQSKFNILNYEKIDYADIFQNKSIFEQTDDLRERVCSRNTVALIITLEHKHTGELLFVTNTHLYWSPKHSDVKLLQTYVLTKMIRRAIKRQYAISGDSADEIIKNKEVNVFMVGDFNSVPDSMVYKFLSTGSVDTSTEPEFKQDYGDKLGPILVNDLGTFRSPYRIPFEAHQFEKTTFTKNFKQIIDYIWYNSGNKNIELVSALGDLDKKYLQGYLGFPNEEFPSDHIPILATFQFK